MMIECLSFFSGIWECEHIILGACHDSGYASFLGKFASNVSIRDRITLLHGGAIHPRIAGLGFTETMQLKSVFAAHPSVNFSISANARISLSPIAPSSSAAPASVKSSVNPEALKDRLGPVFYDDNGKRVDKFLGVDVNDPYLNFSRQAKMCGWFYLRGECVRCDKNHVAPPPKAREFDCL